MGERLSTETWRSLFGEFHATGAALVTLILTFGPIPAHIQSARNLADATSGGLRARIYFHYILAEFAVHSLNCQFAIIHVWVAGDHVLFAMRGSGPRQFYAEILATFGLYSLISLRKA